MSVVVLNRSGCICEESECDSLVLKSSNTAYFDHFIENNLRDGDTVNLTYC